MVPDSLSWSVRQRACEVRLALPKNFLICILGLFCAGSSLGGAPPNPTTGEQQTLVLLVNFQDNPGDKPFTVDEARHAVFGTVNAFFQEASLGKTWLTGDAHGWFTLPISSTCHTGDIAAAANAAAQEANIDISAVGRFLYIFKNSTGCGYSGASSITQYPSESVVNGRLDVDDITHELGHGFGLYHANLLDCRDLDVVLDDACLERNADKFDSMGDAPEVPAHFSAAFKERLGWLGQDEILTVSSDGVYDIGVYETAGSAYPKALKIFKHADPDSGARYYYYVEYRQAIGFDAYLANDPDFASALNGVLVRVAVTAEDLYAGWAVNRNSLLLDMTPNSAISVTSDRQDVALQVGETFSDPASGVSFTVLSADGNVARLQVAVAAAQPTCERGTVDLQVTPANGPLAAAGTPVQYALQVTNQDGSGCEPASISFNLSQPLGWGMSAEPTMLTLSPGSSGSAAVLVTAPLEAADGTYNLEFSAVHSSSPGDSGVASASYTVGSVSSNNPPVALNDSVMTEAPSPVTVQVLANDFDPDGDDLTVISVENGAQGTVTINMDGTVTYQPGDRAKRKDTFGYSISDGMSTAAAIVTVNFSKGSGGGGKGNGKGRR